MVTFVSKVKQSWNKNGNIHTKCRLGYNHASKGEAGYCDKLHMIKDHSDEGIDWIIHEKVYALFVNGVKVCTHKPDWTIFYKDKTTKVIEWKGQEKAMWKLKYKMFKAQYPDIPYEVVYQK